MADTSFPPPGVVRQRTAKIRFVEPLTGERKDAILDAVLAWSYARDLYNAGKMGRSEYHKYENALLMMIATEEVP